MGTGKLSQERLVEYVDEAALACKGDFAEIGVYRGETFQRLARLAAARGRMAHAFDSFCGMDEPGEHDSDKYPKGHLSVGGKQAFVDLMSKAGLVLGIDYQAHEGYVPTCFNGVEIGHKFAFVYIDLDHYWPTRHALAWAKNVVSRGGVILCDDYFPDSSGGPSLAIDEGVQKLGWYRDVLDNDQCVIKC